VVAGEEAPEPYLEAAAEQLVLAGAAARSAQHATDALGGSLAAVLPDARLGGAVPGADELAGIAGQLRASAEAAGPFVERRRATGSVLAALRDALAALDRDDAPAALVALDDAEAALAVVEGWEAPPNVLPIWLDTTRELLGAARRLAEAIVAGDPGAAEAAAADYAAAAEEGRQADTALAIAIAEAGSGIAGTPLRRLTTVRSDLEELRLSVASVLQAGD
jgi:hypothetical protein